MNRMLAGLFLISSLVGASTLWAEAFNAKAQYEQSCAVCHNSGVAGAPRKGDPKAWSKRLAKGETAVLKNVKNGIGAMPAMGMCGECSDGDFKALIKYMAE